MISIKVVLEEEEIQQALVNYIRSTHEVHSSIPLTRSIMTCVVNSGTHRYTAEFEQETIKERDAQYESAGS